MVSGGGLVGRGGVAIGGGGVTVGGGGVVGRCPVGGVRREGGQVRGRGRM